jgi:hypothetical protein
MKKTYLYHFFYIFYCQFYSCQNNKKVKKKNSIVDKGVEIPADSIEKIASNTIDNGRL